MGIAMIFGSRRTLMGFASWGSGGIPRAGEFLKNLKNFLRKLLKCIILAYFSKKLTNHALVLRAVGQKTQIFGKF